MSYYENRIKHLEARIEEMANRERLKAIPVEAKLFDRWAELVKENKRLKIAGDAMVKRLREFDSIDEPAEEKVILNWQAAKTGVDPTP